MYGRWENPAKEEDAAERKGSFIELVVWGGGPSRDRQEWALERRIQRKERLGGVQRASRPGPGHWVACRALAGAVGRHWIQTPPFLEKQGSLLPELLPEKKRGGEVGRR